MENQTTAAQKIFFSYSRTDGQEYALKLANDLRSAGGNVWIDQLNIELGKLWDLEVEKALNTADCVLFIATEKSTTSNNVLNEVYYALDENKKVIPVVFHECRIPFQLRRLQRIDFTTSYNAAFERLLKALGLKSEAAPQIGTAEKNTAISLLTTKISIAQEPMEPQNTAGENTKLLESNPLDQDPETREVTSNKTKMFTPDPAPPLSPNQKEVRSRKPVFLAVGVLGLAVLVFVLLKVLSGDNSNKPSILGEQYPNNEKADTTAKTPPSNNGSNNVEKRTEDPDNDTKQEKKHGNNTLSSEEKYQNYLQAGLNHLDQKLYKEAISDFTKAYETKDEAAPFFHLGTCYAGLSEYANAINYYGKAIERNPKNWNFFAARAVANHKNKDFKASVQDWSQVIELTTGDEQANAYYRRGVNRNAINDATGACKDFAEAGRLGNTEGQKAYDRNCGSNQSIQKGMKTSLKNLKTKRATSTDLRY